MKRKTDKPSVHISSINGPEISSELQQKLKANPFAVPEGYFDSLQERIQGKIESYHEVAPIRPFPVKILLWASAAAVLIILSLAFFLRSELRLRKAELITQNEYNLHNMMQDKLDSSKISDVNNKVTPVGMETAKSHSSLNHASVVPLDSPKKASPSRQKFDQVIKTLEKEGVSDEDIMQYLLDEDIDPVDLNNQNN